MFFTVLFCIYMVSFVFRTNMNLNKNATNVLIKINGITQNVLCAASVIYILQNIAFSYKNALHFITAFFAAPVFLWLIHLIFYKERLPLSCLYKGFRYKMPFSDTINIVKEELIWRFLPVFFFKENWFANILIIFATNFIFIYAVHSVRDKKQGKEMFLFSLLFWVKLVFPGANYGLHLGHNNYILLFRTELDGE